MGTLIYVNLCYGYKLRLYRVFINMVHVMYTIYNVMFQHVHVPVQYELSGAITMVCTRMKV